MESLDNLKPFDDLEVLSDDVDLFMEAMCHPPHMADVLWQQAKLKKQENSDLYANNHRKPEKINPRLDRTGDPISGLSWVATTKKNTTTLPQESNQSIFDKRWIEEPERLTLVQSYNHWMNENALRMEMGIPLVPHPKHTFSKIHGLSESESELDELLQLGKDAVSTQAEADLNKDVQDDQDSSPNLVIYSTLEGRTVC